MPARQKLTDAEVIVIKTQLALPAPPSLAALGREYHVNPTTIRRIRDGKLRRNVAALPA